MSDIKLYCQEIYKSSALLRAFNEHPQIDKKSYWIASSGSTQKNLSHIKLVGLSEEAISFSAQSANQFLDIHSKTRIYNTLPNFHIAAIAAKKRAELSGASFIDRYSSSYKWKVQDFVEDLKETQASLCSLVPAQIFDIVQNRLQAPQSIQYVLVGGGALSEDLLERASLLGWPILVSYGATETASQIATTSPFERNSKPGSLKKLPHLDWRLDLNSYLQIRSKSLFHAYVHWRDEKLSYEPLVLDADGFWTSEDIAELNGDYLKVFGRGIRFAKILGENVSLSAVEEDLCRSLEKTCVVLALANPRRSYELAVIVEGVSSLDEQKIADYNAEKSGFLRISSLHEMPILRANTHKPLYAAMLEALKASQNAHLIRTFS